MCLGSILPRLFVLVCLLRVLHSQAKKHSPLSEKNSLVYKLCISISSCLSKIHVASVCHFLLSLHCSLGACPTRKTTPRASRFRIIFFEPRESNALVYVVYTLPPHLLFRSMPAVRPLDFVHTRSQLVCLSRRRERGNCRGKEKGGA